MNICDLLLCYR